jgi:tetratricopeptide (TPR) repeat protein
VSDRLRPLWDFDDLDVSEERFLEQRHRETTDEGRAEVLTQLARVQGLRDRFVEGEQLIHEAEALAGAGRVARIRIDLERGRLLRSAGDPAGALPLFVSAYEKAVAAGEHFLAADAAHMAMIAAPDRQAKLDWTQRGIDIAEASTDSRVSYWLGPLLNNLGWEFHDAGEYEAALAYFRRALEVRERYPENPAGIQLARDAIEEALRSLQGQRERQA